MQQLAEEGFAHCPDWKYILKKRERERELDENKLIQETIVVL